MESPTFHGDLHRFNGSGYFPAMDLYIEFDARQLTFRSNIAEVREYVADTFRHMLVPSVRNSAGKLEFNRTADGYSLRSEATLDYANMSLESLIPLIKDEVRLQFMRARPDLLWMHAGAIARSGGALLLAGKSGQGKSTLTTYLCEHGWRFLSDDVAPVRMDVDRVIPFMQMPVRRLHPGREVRWEDLNTLDRETVDVTPEKLCRDESEIRGIVFIEYEKDAEAQLVRLDQGSAAMEILRNATNFFDHRGAAVERAANLVNRVPMYRLAYGLPRSASKVLDGLW